MRKLRPSETPAPDKVLIEKGPHGPLPELAAMAASPWDVYSRPVATSSKLPLQPPNRPDDRRMGLSQNATRHALEKLPRSVTLAFAPYGQGLAGQVGRRAIRHEVMLQARSKLSNLAERGQGRACCAHRRTRPS